MANNYVHFLTLHCVETEDNTGADEAYLKWDGKTFWGPTSINDGEERSIDQLLRMQGDSGNVELWDEDSPDGDDWLGTNTIYASEAGQGEKKALFKEDGADYWLSYKVISL